MGEKLKNDGLRNRKSSQLGAFQLSFRLKTKAAVVAGTVFLFAVFLSNTRFEAADVARAKAADSSVVRTDLTVKHRGEVTDVEGQARRLPMLAQDWIAAVKGSEVISGDKVRTLRDSRAELALKELNIIRMAPLTTIDIVKLYEETKEGRDETAINVEKGDIWALINKVEEEAVFNISTPVAGAAITGTKFRLSVEEDSTTVLKVYKGEVQVTNAPYNRVLVPQPLPGQGRRQIEGPQQISAPRQVSFEEWYYIVKNMQEIRIGKDGRLLSSGIFSSDDPDEQTDWVQWNLKRDRELER